MKKLINIFFVLAIAAIIILLIIINVLALIPLPVAKIWMMPREVYIENQKLKSFIIDENIKVTNLRDVIPPASTIAPNYYFRKSNDTYTYASQFKTNLQTSNDGAQWEPASVSSETVEDEFDAQKYMGDFDPGYDEKSFPNLRSDIWGFDLENGDKIIVWTDSRTRHPVDVERSCNELCYYHVIYSWDNAIYVRHYAKNELVPDKDIRVTHSNNLLLEGVRYKDGTIDFIASITDKDNPGPFTGERLVRGTIDVRKWF